MLGKDSTGRDVMIGTVSSNPRPVEEAGPREGTFGYSFALRDPSQLTMKRFFFRTHPNPEPELTHLRTRWPADSDAGQAAVSRLRESFQLRIPVEASPEDLSSDPVPVEIENALAHTSGECSDLVWLDELVRSLASILPTADELLPFTTKGGIKCYSIPATGTLSAYWLRFRDGDAEKIRLVIESGVNSPMESLESEGRPAEITLLASREGKDYRVFAGVECGITNGTGFLLGPNGTFKMKPCLDEEGKYSSISFTDMVKSDLPSRSSGLPADAAESLWKALDAYLPQLSE